MRIRKTYNGVVPNGKILNSYSTSQNDGYSCDYINNEFDDVNTILTNLNQNAMVYKDTVYKSNVWDNIAMGTYYVNTWTGSGGDGNYPAANIIGMLIVIPNIQVVFSTAKIYVRVKSTTWSAWKSVTLS